MNNYENEPNNIGGIIKEVFSLLWPNGQPPRTAVRAALLGKDGICVTDDKEGAGGIAEKAAAPETAEQDHDQRYHRGLRCQPDDVLLPLQGYLRPCGLDHGRGCCEGAGGKAHVRYVVGGLPRSPASGAGEQGSGHERLPLGEPGAGGTVLI